MGAFLMGETIFIAKIDKRLGQPAGEIHVGAERINLILRDHDGDLDSALPTPLLDVEYTGGSEGSSLHWLRSDKQGHAELRKLWSMLNGHGGHCSTTTRLNGWFIDGFLA